VSREGRLKCLKAATGGSSARPSPMRGPGPLNYCQSERTQGRTLANLCGVWRHTTRKDQGRTAVTYFQTKNEVVQKGTRSGGTRGSTPKKKRPSRGQVKKKQNHHRAQEGGTTTDLDGKRQKSGLQINGGQRGKTETRGKTGGLV